MHLTEDQIAVAITRARTTRLGTFSADDQSWRAINISAPGLINAEHRIALLFSVCRRISLIATCY